MARPWIPRLFVFSGLHHKPGVAVIAQATGLSKDAAVGVLFRVWIEFQLRATPAGTLEGKSAPWLDCFANVPGFAAGMAQAGWLVIEPTRLTIPSFDEFISKKAIKRIEDAMRKAAKREEAADGSGYSSDLGRHAADKVAVTPPVPVVVPPAPVVTVRKAVTVKSSGDPRFDRFWAAYPRRTAKAAAETAWRKLVATDKLSADELLALILKALEWQTKQERWLEGDQFIPHPATWLNGRRWLDEPGRPVRGGARVQPEEAPGRAKRIVITDEGDPVPGGPDPAGPGRDEPDPTSLF